MQKDKSIKLFDLCVGILIVLISLIGMLGLFQIGDFLFWDKYIMGEFQRM